MKPVVSVIMPVYNTEKYLRECLDSVCAQTLKDIEIICVDDGSTDSSPAILAEYAAKDPRIKIITRGHSNAGACRNAGMDIARGEFLSFLDSDDVFAPKMLEILVCAIEKHSADIATCDICRFQDGSNVPEMAASKEPNVSVYGHPVQNVDTFFLWVGRPWDKMFRKPFIDGLGIKFQEQRSTNDEFFIDIAVASSSCIVHVNETLVAYRQHASSLQATQNKDPYCIISAIDAIFAEMTNRRLFEEHPALYTYFRGWLARVTGQLKRISTIDAYKQLYEALREKIIEHRLDGLTQDETHFSVEDYDWFRSLVSGGGYPEVLMAEVLQLRKENIRLKQELRGPSSLSHSWDFRLGRSILYIPHRVKWLLKNVLGMKR